MTGSRRSAAGWARRVPTALAALGTLGLLGVVGLTIADILLRWLVNAPIPGASEIAELTLIFSLSAFFPLALASGQTLTIRIVGGLLGPGAARVLNVFGAALTVVFFALIGWQLAAYALETARAGEATWFLLLPVAPVWWAAAALALVATATQIAATIDVWRDRPGEGRFGRAP